MIKLIYSSILVFLFCAQLSAQDDPFKIEMQKGSDYEFSLTIIGDNLDITDEPMAGNVLEITSVVGSNYKLRYTPNPNFVGDDGFKIQDQSFFPPSVKNYTFEVVVSESMVLTEDDFIKIDSDQMVTIDPVANDESTASDISISIAQVMYGEAVVTADNTIEYTPSDRAIDYIVYTGVDMYGTSSTSTVYITKNDDLPSGNTSDEIDLPSGAVEYIFLPANGYNFLNTDVEYGTLNQVNDYVWQYEANAATDGDETITFENADGLSHIVSISVIEKYVDDGFVKDDILYSAKNTQITFNVKENDVNGLSVITDYSDELYHSGDGVFSYTPEPGNTGVVELFYNANDGTNEESGSIKIIIGNYNPSSNVDYSISTPKNQPRVIEYEVPIGTEFFEIETYPSHGTLEVFNNEESIDLGCEVGLQKVFAVYSPNDNFVGADNVVLRYFASGNNLPKYSNIVIVTEDTDVEDACICVDDCVWPGDANGDGNVNVRDALSVGRYLGQTGAPRDASPFGDIYKGVQVTEWDGAQVSNGKSVGYADANGDGIISTEDVLEIEANYGSVHTLVPNDLFSVKNIPFYLTASGDAEVGEVKEIYIHAGTEAYPAIDMSGIAFSVNLPENSVDINSIELQYVEENFFVKGAPYIDMTHISDDAIVHSAGVKTNGANSTGNGVIAVLSFIVIEDAEGIKPQGRSAANADDKFMIELTDIVYEGGSGQQFSIPSSTLVLEKGAINNIEQEVFTVYPNPAADIIKVESSNGIDISSLRVYSATGEKVIDSKNVSANQTSIDVSQFQRGLYFIDVTSLNGNSIMKFVKE